MDEIEGGEGGGEGGGEASKAERAAVVRRHTEEMRQTWRAGLLCKKGHHDCPPCSFFLVYFLLSVLQSCDFQFVYVGEKTAVLDFFSFTHKLVVEKRERRQRGSLEEEACPQFKTGEGEECCRVKEKVRVSKQSKSEGGGWK